MEAPASAESLAALTEHHKRLKPRGPDWLDFLKTFGVSSAHDLTYSQADEADGMLSLETPESFRERFGGVA